MQNFCMKTITAAPEWETAVINTIHKGKTMKLTRTPLLVLALSGSAYAGNMQNGVAPPPQPTNEQTEEQTTEVTSETPEETAPPTLTEIVLTVVSVMGLI